MPIRSFSKQADLTDIIAAFREDGAVIVNDLASDELTDRIRAELRPELDRSGLDSADVFNGALSLRIGRVLAASPSAAELVDHDMVVDIANEILLPFAASYQVSSLTAIEILPGEKGQALHRDDTVYPMDIAGMEFQISVMWALDDFTEENGGTRVVPGSHRQLRAWHLPNLDNWEAAVMPKGSAVFYLGSTWHGGGANHSDAPRMGLVNVYSLGWLRQEVNQYLAHPPELAQTFSPRLRALLGYMAHGFEDPCGVLSGDCPAWVDEPPEPAWDRQRGSSAATEDDVKMQAGGGS